MTRPVLFSVLLAVATLPSDQAPGIVALPATGEVCGTGMDGRPLVAPDVQPGDLLWVRQSPGALAADHAGVVTLEIVYSGDIAAVRVFYLLSGSTYQHDEFLRHETRTIAGTTVSVFHAVWSMAEFLRRFGLGLDFTSGTLASVALAPVSVPLGSNGWPASYRTFGIRTISRSLGSVPVVRVDNTAQYSSHVINVVVPGLAGTLGPADTFDTAAVTRHVYAYLGDDYDSLAIVFQEKPYQGSVAAYHQHVRNDIAGIGLGLFDSTAAYGSAGRLQGVEVYLGSLYNLISNHELSHQWGHFFDWAAIAGVTTRDRAHTPLWGFYESPIPAVISPASRVVPPPGGSPDEWQLERAPSPTRIPPLQAYAMGLIGPSEVPPVTLFDDQFRSVSGVFTALTRPVSMAQVVAVHGPRQGPVVRSVRRATVLVSRDALASQREMDFWTFHAQRLEDVQRAGLLDLVGIGTFESVTGIPLRTALVLPQALAAHPVVEPGLHAGEFPGVTLDRAFPHVLATPGVFRLSGHITDPALAAATLVDGQAGHLGWSSIATSQIRADGSFALVGALNVPAGTGQMSLAVRDATGRVLRSLQALGLRVVNAAAPPASPVAIRGTVSGRNVSLTWSPDTGPAPLSYVIDAGSSPGATDIGRFPTTTPSLTAPEVADGTYFVRIRAVNAAGSSPASEEIPIVVGCPRPTPVGGLEGAVDGDLVSLSWSPSPSPGVRYAVVASSRPAGADTVIDMGAALGLETAAPPGRYFVRVRALTPCGAFADSLELELLVRQPGAPGAPTDLVATVNGSQVVFAWQPPSGGIDAFVIEAGSGPGLADLARLRVGPVTSHAVSSVPAGVYFVRVRAVNAAGEGLSSNEIRVVVS